MKLVIFLSLILFSCKQKPSNDILPFLRFFVKNSELVTLQGKVSGPGVVKNAIVSVVSLSNNSNCVTEKGKPNGNVLASTKTNEKGEYSLSYPRTGGMSCLVVTGEDGTTMEVNYGNKKAVPWTQGNHLFTVFQEPKNAKRSSEGRLSSSKIVNANPFTRLASNRFLASRRNQNTLRSKNLWSKFRSLVTKSKTDEDLLEDAYQQTTQTFFKGTNTKGFKLEEANPETKTFQARLGAIQTYAEKVGLPSGASKSQYTGEIDPQNLVKVLNFMEKDFSDGSFDGKEIGENGEVAQIAQSELEELGLNSSSADHFLKDEFLDALKYFVDFHEDFSENFWRAVSFCDSDDEQCEIVSSSELPFSSYPYDGQTNVSSFFFVSISFFEEIKPESLSVQSQNGNCTGTIQISSDNFNTCLGATLEADSYFVILYNESSSFQESTTYKLKIVSASKSDGTSLITSPYIMQTGFTVVPSLYAISDQIVYDDLNYAVWTRCVLGTNFDTSCSGYATTVKFCSTLDNSCNGNETGGFLVSGPLYDACEYLNSIEFGGVGGWRVPYIWELATLASHSNFSAVVPDYETNVWSANSDSLSSFQAIYYDSSYGSLTQNKDSSTAVRCISNFIP